MSTGDKIRHKAEEMKGAAKEKWGDATDDPAMQAEGAAERRAARARQAGDHLRDAGRNVGEALR